MLYTTMQISFNRQLIDSVVLGAIIFFMRRDVTLALVIAVANYVLRMV